MKKIKRIIPFLLIILIFLSCTIGSKIRKGFLIFSEDSIDKNNIIDIITELSSPKYEGRLAGTLGNKLTEDYIADYFNEIGLLSPDSIDNYRQEYTQGVKICNSAPVLNIIDNQGKVLKSFSYPKNFICSSMAGTKLKGNITEKMAVVYNMEELKKNGEKFKDKVVVVLSSVRREAGNNQTLFKLLNSIGIKGAILEIDIFSPTNPYKHLPISGVPGDIEKYDNSGPLVIYAESNTIDELSDAALKDLSVNISVDFSGQVVKASNIIGIIPGTDEKLKDEFIIIGGHMDHIGDNKNGEYNPGALDNASGVACMMELARIIKQGRPPKKSILFIAFNGEEEGLLGSYHYAENPFYALDKAVVINLDMVGSKNEIPLSIAGMGESKLRLDLAAYASYLNILYERTMEEGSDHSPFAERGVEAVTLIHLDIENEAYHTPKDSIDDTIDKDRIGEVCKLVLYYIDKNAYN